MKKISFLLFVTLCCLFSCNSEKSKDGVWTKTIGFQKLYMYDIDGCTGFEVIGNNDRIEMSGIFDWENDSVCTVYNRQGKNLGKATFHYTFKPTENVESRFIDGFYGGDFWNKDENVDGEQEKAIKAALTVLIPEIKEKIKK